MLRIAVLLVCLMAAACSATGPLFVPAAPVDGKAIVYVYRMNKDDGLAARDAYFYVDDRHAFDLRPNGYSYIALAPGEHNLRLEWAWDVLAPPFTIPLTVRAGETHYYRLVVLAVNDDENTTSWRWSVRDDAPDAGMREISTKHFQAPDK